ncbi:MAG: CehA/McbA family metallohydrolase [Candidatus Paceibacterota bacterium]
MKIDLHCHTYYSKDSICSPKSLVDSAIGRGLDGIAITDHNSARAWPELIEYCARKKMLLILGEEIKVKENGKTIGEILAYFIVKEIDPKNKTIEEIIKEIRDQGGIAVMAHPFHRSKPFKDQERYAELFDAIECFNSRSQTTAGNAASQKIVGQYSLPFVAGSDAHTPWEVGNAFIEAEQSSTEELKTKILNRQIKFQGKQTPLMIQIFAPISKFARLFWKP